jgi:splicing factor 3B subunit 3
MPPNAMTDEIEAQPVHAVAMKLLDLRLQPSTAIVQSVLGEFTGPHELALLKTSGVIELYKLSDEKLHLVTRVETRSILRHGVAVRFPGTSHDVLVVTSDSGALSVLQFQPFAVLHNVTFGKTGCRRATPGQYLAADPKGRAVMVSAVEKRQLVYVLNRTADGKTTLSSPLEAHRTRNLILATVGLDNGYDNPLFATLELQYPEETETNIEPELQLAYYELDLGLNHVSRRWATPVPQTACCLAALPGGADGPGGVLMGAEDWLYYVHEKNRIVCPIPRREMHTSKGVLITTVTVHRQKKAKFFALAQSELGDVYKVSIVLNEDKSAVSGLEVSFLDTLPTANTLNVSKLGLLFVAAEFGDHALYQFERIDVPDAPSNTSVEETELTTAKAVSLAKTFAPVSRLQNLRKIWSLDNAAPTNQILVGELAGNEVSPQIYTLTGRGPHSTIRTMRHGAAVTELAVSDLPGVPGGIFTVADASGEKDQYIVVSFADATLVLSVGESVEEVGKESGFLITAPTLACSALGQDGSVCQVHPAGVRHIQKGQARQWHCPGLKRIEFASANTSQVLIALAGGEIIYFELDAISGNLTESSTKDMGADVCCLDIGTIDTGKSRSLFAAIGCRDQTVRIVSLEPGQLLTQKSSLALKSRPHSVVIQSIKGVDMEGKPNGLDDLTLNIGLDDGSSLRVFLDPVTGSVEASPSRRFLGAIPVSVSRIELNGQKSTLLLSSRPWISRRDESTGKHLMAPLSYVPLDHGCSFRSDAIPEGIVATAGKTLRILSVDTDGMGGGDDEAFNTNKADLRYTPRQMTLVSVSNTTDQRKVVLVVVESDCNEYGLEEKKAMGFDPTAKVSSKGDDADAMDMDEDSDDEGEKKDLPEGDGDEDEEEKDARKTPVRGPLPSKPGTWGSCVRLLDPSANCSTLDCIEMGRNEAALCCASVRFHSKGGEPLLAVGTVTGMTMNPLKQVASHIVLYRIVDGGRLQLLHRTAVEDGPVLALAHFQGRLLAGIGKSLRLFEMGKRQLLRKCEQRGLPTFVKTIQTVGDRAFVGDMMQSIQVFRYDAMANRFVTLAIDPSPRPIVSQELLDFNTVAVSDKFGNISILRMPRGAEAGAIDMSGQRALWDSSRTDSTPKLELLCQYYVGEVVTAMTRSSLVAGGAESIIYVTACGRIGALVPFSSRADVEFFTQLETALRTEVLRPTGRDPQSYRSYYAPALHVIDGELCEAFNSLPHDKQAKIAAELERSPGDIMKKLEDTRNALH